MKRKIIEKIKSITRKKNEKKKVKEKGKSRGRRGRMRKRKRKKEQEKGGVQINYSWSSSHGTFRRFITPVARLPRYSSPSRYLLRKCEKL